MILLTVSYSEMSMRCHMMMTSYVLAYKHNMTSLHQAGFMHGDIRSTNIMMRKNGPPVILLLDFDWAGVIGGQ